MSSRAKIYIAYFVIVFFVACGGGGGGSSSGGGTSYDGTWSGSTSQGKTISFKVENNAITSLTVEFSYYGVCTVGGSLTYTFSPPKSITGNTFSIEASTTGSGYYISYFTITGSFSSSTSVLGSLQFALKSCSSITWNATKS